MVNRIITFSLDNRFLVVLFAGLLAVTGAWSFGQLPLDAFPDITPVQVQVLTVAPALNAEEMEAQVTFPVEQAIAGLPGLTEVRSTSKFGYSRVQAIFEDGTDVLRARQLTSERLTTVTLPDTAGTARPRLGPITSALGEVYQYLLLSDQHDLTELRTLHDWLVKPQLRTVPGVAEVNSFGGYEQQFAVRLDPDRLIKYDLTLDHVTEALKANNVNVGGGYLERAGELHLIQGVGLVSTVEEIADIVLASYEGVPVRIGDVADVEIGHEVRRGAVTYDGRGEVVLGLAFMLLGENSRDVTERLRAKMVDIERSLPEGVRVQQVYSRTDLVDMVLDTAAHNLFYGAILVVAALFVLGGGLRAGLIVALAVPLSFLFAGNLMFQTGIAASLMSLGAIDFGILIDSSVIMVENSVRHLAENHTGRDVKQVVRDASIEVRRPTLFGEAIIMIVYLPILTLIGVEGKMFRPMALTVLFALAGSLVLSLTLMPVLASLFLPKRVAQREPLVVRAGKALYRPVLTWVLANRGPVLVIALAVMAATGLLASELGTEFVPQLNEGSIIVNTVRLNGVSLEESVRYTTKMEQVLLREFPDEIEHIWSRTGMGEEGTEPMGIEMTDIFLTLRPAREWKRARTQDELVREIDVELAGLPGTNILFTQPIEMLIRDEMTGIRANLGVKVFGDDFETLAALSQQVADELQRLTGAADVAADQVLGQPVLRVSIDEATLAHFGIPRREVMELIQALGTLHVGEIRQGQMRFPLVVRLADRYREDPEAVGHILLPTEDGHRIPLEHVTRIEQVEGPSVIEREWAKRFVPVQCNVRGRDLGSFVQEAQQRIGELVESWPAGYYVTWGGQFEHMQRAQRRLAMVVPLAGLLIFALLYVAFNSVRDALLIFSGVPFAVVGGVVALYVRGMPFSISAGVGFIALFGIAVLNGLVLVSYIRQLLGEGWELDRAISQAGQVRLRPVLMTAVTDALGFVPMMLATGIGAEVQRPLATVVVGGVISSMLLTLLVLPVLYSLFGKGFEEEHPAERRAELAHVRATE
jgi:cobalt-zinc-cadmium resistance protein CzcA